MHFYRFFCGEGKCVCTAFYCLAVIFKAQITYRLSDAFYKWHLSLLLLSLTLLKPVLMLQKVQVYSLQCTVADQQGGKCTGFDDEDRTRVTLCFLLIFGFHSQKPWGKVTGFQNTKASQNIVLYNPVDLSGKVL